MYLADAQDAYSKRLKQDNDKHEKDAWAKLRGSKALENLLREAGYTLEVQGAKSLAYLEQQKAEAARTSAQADEPGAPYSQSAAPVEAGAGAATKSRARDISSYLLRSRRWLHESERNSSGPRSSSIMEGGLPRTDASYLTKQLAAMMHALGGRYGTSHREGAPLRVGGDLAKLVYWLLTERKRDRNPAAVPDHEPGTLEYRPPPQLQVTILPEQRQAKKARADGG